MLTKHLWLTEQEYCRVKNSFVVIKVVLVVVVLLAVVVVLLVVVVVLLVVFKGIMVKLLTGKMSVNMEIKATKGLHLCCLEVPRA